MSLNRRIVLEDDEICVPVKPESFFAETPKHPLKEPPRGEPTWTDPPQSPLGASWTAAAERIHETARYGDQALNVPTPVGPRIPGFNIQTGFVDRVPASAEQVPNVTIDLGAIAHWAPGRRSRTAFNGPEEALTFDEFFQRVGLPPVGPTTVVTCKGCGRSGAFDADFGKQTIQCLGCGRNLPFDQFKKEQTR